MFFNAWFKKSVEWCQGRHTLFAVYFALSGTALQWYHRLDMNYVALITAVQGLVLAHSVKEDYYKDKDDKDKGDHD
jgi:hypothetical protein